MLGRAYVDGSLAAVALATAAYCAGRLIDAALRGRRVEHAVDVTHVVMGVGMASMLVSNLSFVGATVWMAVFAVLAAWSVLHIIVGSLSRHGCSHDAWHYGGHVLSAGAMLYMYNAPTAARDGMKMAMPSASQGTHPVTVAPLLATVLFGYAILVMSRIPAAAAVSTHGEGWRGDRRSFARGADGDVLPPAPRAGLVCDAVMSLATGIMLVTML